MLLSLVFCAGFCTAILSTSCLDFRLLLPVSSHYSGDLSLEIANPVTPHTSFETHGGASQAVRAPSAHPWYVCFSLMYFKSFVFKAINLSTNQFLEGIYMMIQNFLRERIISVFFPEINVISGFSAFFLLWIILWHRFLQPLVDTDGSTGTTLDRSIETWELKAMNFVRSRVNGQIVKGNRSTCSLFRWVQRYSQKHIA